MLPVIFFFPFYVNKSLLWFKACTGGFKVYTTKARRSPRSKLADLSGESKTGSLLKCDLALDPIYGGHMV